MVSMEEGFVDEPADVTVIGQIEDVVAVAPGPHQPAEPQLGQVLGHRCRLGADMLSEAVDRVLAV